MTLRRAASSLALSALLVACSDSPSNPGRDFDAIKDTSVNDTGADQTGSPDGTLADAEGDAPQLPDGYEAPIGSVKYAQLEAEKVDCTSANFVTVLDSVSLTNVVVVSPKFDAYTPKAGSTGTALDGYYVADPDGGLYSGLAVVVDRTKATDFQPGDVMDLQGELEEYYCQTQLDLASWTKTGTAEIPEPLTVAPQHVANEAYEGMYLHTTDTVVEALGGGTYLTQGGFVVDHQFDFFLSMEVGKTYELTGFVSFSFDQYRLNPPSADDVVLVGGGPGPDAITGDTSDAGGDTGPTTSGIVALQSSPESVNCTVQEIQNFAKGVQLEGVVTVGQFSAAANLHGYYISDGTQAPWSGINIVVDKSKNTNFQVGQVVKLTGDHTEFYCMTQVKATSIQAIGEADVPDPVLLTEDELLAEAELWEGVLVQVPDLTVASNGAWDNNGYVTFQGGLLMDRSILGTQALAKPEVGTHWDLVVGVVRYNFEQYRIVPRTLDDLIEDAGPTDPEPTEDAGTTDTVEDVADEDIGPEPEVVEDAGPSEEDAAAEDDA